MNINEILNSTNSKKNFLKGLILISKTDGVEEEEKVFFEQAGMALQLDQNSIEEIESFWNKSDIEIEFENKQQSLFFLREAIQLCYVDNGYTDNEKCMILKLAKMLEVNEEIVNKIEEWVVEGIKWSKKGEQIINMEA